MTGAAALDNGTGLRRDVNPDHDGKLDMTVNDAGASVLAAGGGIGGPSAVLALARRGFAVKVLEQASASGEISAGIQPGPNAFAAFAHDERSRLARTARVVLSAREMGRIYHAKGVERLIRSDLWRGRTPERYYEALEWLYGWRADQRLA